MRLALILAFALVTTPVLAQPAWLGELQPLLDEIHEADDLPGIGLAIGWRGEIVWSGGAGYADLENDIAFDGDTVHRIASISKPITAVAALQLVEQGKFGLDDSIQPHIAFWPEKPWPITPRQLLSHTSGIRHYRGVESSSMERYTSTRAALRIFKDDDLLFEPGTAVQYSTYAYTVLAGVVEKTSGEDFGDYLSEHVWQPSGMASTHLEHTGPLVKRRARGYSRGRGGAIWNANYTNLSYKWAGGGMLSSAKDLVRFAIALESDLLLQADTRAMMLTRQTLANGKQIQNGLGWFVAADDDERRYSHSGGQAGTATLLNVFPERGLVIASLINLDGAGQSNGKLHRRIAKIAHKQ